MYRKLFLIAAGAFVQLACLSQDKTLSELNTHYRNYTDRIFVEKVYIHLDKPGYSAGETIWFKAYDVDGSNNQPATVSKVLYAEVLNQKNEAVLQGKIKLENGTGSGSFYLPFSIPSGNYRFRAYTSWMKNFSADYYFEQPIFVVNAFGSAPTQDTSSNKASLFVGVYPEGGSLVTGLSSRCGVKVTSANGSGIDFTGVVVNQLNDTITRFQSLKFGMGHFDFTPVAGANYRAIVVTTIGETKEIALPGAANEGAVLSLSDEGSRIKLTVRSTTALHGQPLYLLAHTRQQLKKAEMRMFLPNATEFYINKDELGPGISHITLFNQYKQPLCERLFFQPPTEQLFIDAQTGSQVYGTRTKGGVEITTRDAAGRSLPANLSMGIYRIDPLQPATPATIVSYLWLSSDLAGFIEAPDYYFSPGDEVVAARDNLMLTQGWRKFKWDDVSHNRLPAFYYLPEYEGHIIDGKLTSKKTGLPASNIPVFVSPVGGKNFGTAFTNSDGYFLAVVKDFYGAGDIVLQTNNRDDSYQFAIGNPFSTEYAQRTFPQLSLSPANSDDILNAGIESQAQNMFLKDSLQRMNLPTQTDTTAFYGRPDAKYFLDNYTRFNTMEEVMREYISGVAIRKQSGRFHFRVNNIAREHFFSNDPLVLLDGVPIFDVDKVATHNPLMVKKIEVVSRQYLLNNVSWPGIVSYTSYKEKLDGFQLDPTALLVNYEGLQLAREFYSPIYETSAQVESRLPDFRNQLVWRADLDLGTTGRTTVPFYTSDLEGRYAGLVQGITDNGAAASKIFFFEVKKK